MVCNSDEGEPGTCKGPRQSAFQPAQPDRSMAIAAYTMNVKGGYNYVHGESTRPMSAWKQPCEEARKAGYLGNNILGSGFTFDLHNHLGYGAYVCGEETALLESLEAQKRPAAFQAAIPRQLRPATASRPPSITPNLRQHPLHHRPGGKKFADMGVVNSGGVKLFSVSGHVNNPGNLKCRWVRHSRNCWRWQGGVRNGHKLKAVIPVDHRCRCCLARS